MDLNLYQILCLVGLPSILSGIIGGLIVKVKEEKRAKNASDEALKKGLQALLRDRLLELYYRASERGSVSYDERTNFMNLYSNYHTLGENGVMDQIQEEYLNLPMR